MKGLFDLTGKTIIVTGGNGHLGRAICAGLAQHGANLVIASRSKDACCKFTEDLSRRYKIQAVGMHVDIMDTDSIRSLYDSVIKRFGSIDVVFNNAFVPVQGFLEELDDALWRKGLDGTAGVVFRCVREVLPYMVEKKTGRIINIASMYGCMAPDPELYGSDLSLNNPASYGAGKAAVIQLTKYVASYYGRYGILSNCISPGPFPNVETQKDTDFMTRLGKKTMLGRIGHPDELKGAAVFLASDASSFITGQNICVDGGATAW